MADLPQNRTEQPEEFVILGKTSDGRQFRPSDWADRLCGVMSGFRPAGSGGRNAHLGYSPYVRPAMRNGIKAVIVSYALRDLEPLAFHFVVNFAKDNDLEVIDGPQG
jgi:hypothetical protein